MFFQDIFRQIWFSLETKKLSISEESVLVLSSLLTCAVDSRAMENVIIKELTDKDIGKRSLIPSPLLSNSAYLPPL